MIRAIGSAAASTSRISLSAHKTAQGGPTVLYSILLYTILIYNETLGFTHDGEIYNLLEETRWFLSLHQRDFFLLFVCAELSVVLATADVSSAVPPEISFGYLTKCESVARRNAENAAQLGLHSTNGL